MPGGERRDLAFPRECVLVPWLMLEDVQGQRWGDLGLRAEQLGRVFLFLFCFSWRNSALFEEGGFLMDGAGTCPGFRSENWWCCSTVTKCGGETS